LDESSIPAKFVTEDARVDLVSVAFLNYDKQDQLIVA